MHNNMLLRYRQLISLTADKSPVGYFNRVNCLIFSSLDGDAVIHHQPILKSALFPDKKTI